MTSATDEQALEALQVCMRYEGLLPALESCHGIAHALSLLPTLSPETVIVCNMSGRGEKDLFITAPRLDPEWKDFISRTAEKYH
jgi:tryptophan synthase beta chain